jgi:chemotaxis protein MotB
MKKSTIMMAVACGLILSSCASKKDLENCQTENKSLTIVVIAHRDSSIEYCDRITTLK